MTVTNTKPQILEIRKDSDRPKQKPVSTVTPLASKFAIKLSTLLRRASRQKRDKMIEQLLIAGVDSVDGWSLKELAVGRINRFTGNRMLPDGTIARTHVTRSSGDGRYYGSSTHAPVTSLNQVGVVWSPAS